jgi:hypothetical protein
MLGGEILSAAGIRPPRYYQLIDKAEQSLQDPARADRATEGVYSAARLYLNGKLAITSEPAK